jgi:hypothetical protein
MNDVKLIITEASDAQMKIAGVISDAKWVKSIAGRAKEAHPIELQLEKENVAAQLEQAVVHGILGGAMEEEKVMFKHPIVIKSAAAKKPVVTLDDFGLSEAIKQASAGTLTKSATNSFCDELVEAIEDSKVDAQGALNLSMPLKIEFRDEATKQAFMGLGRKRKLKKLASAIAQLGRNQLLDRMAQKLAHTKAAEPKGQKIQPGSRKGGKSEPASKAAPGSGGRFKAMKKKLSGKVRDPGAVAAAIGRSKYGKGKFQQMAASGKK